MYYLSNARGASPQLGLLDRARRGWQRGDDSDYEVQRASPYKIKNIRALTPRAPPRSAPVSGRKVASGLGETIAQKRELGSSLDMFFRTPKPPKKRYLKARLRSKQDRTPARPQTTPSAPPKLKLHCAPRASYEKPRAAWVDNKGPKMVASNIALVRTPREELAQEKKIVEDKKSIAVEAAIHQSKDPVAFQDADAQTSFFPWDAWGKAMMIFHSSDPEASPETQAIPEELLHAANVELLENVRLLQRENNSLRSRLLEMPNAEYEKPPVWFESHSRVNSVLRERLFTLIIDYRKVELAQSRVDVRVSEAKAERDATVKALQAKEKSLERQLKGALSKHTIQEQKICKMDTDHRNEILALRTRLEKYANDAQLIRAARKDEAATHRAELKALEEEMRNRCEESTKVGDMFAEEVRSLKMRLQNQSSAIAQLEDIATRSENDAREACTKHVAAERNTIQLEEKCTKQRATIETLENQLTLRLQAETLKGKLSIAEAKHDAAIKEYEIAIQNFREERSIKEQVQQRASIAIDKCKSLERELGDAARKGQQAEERAGKLEEELMESKQLVEIVKRDFQKRSSASADRERKLVKQVMDLTKRLNSRGAGVNLTPPKMTTTTRMPFKEHKGAEMETGAKIKHGTSHVASESNVRETRPKPLTQIGSESPRHRQTENRF